MRDTVAAVNWAEYGDEAVRAFAAASTPDELAEAQVRYLGRRAELPQALRGVRDRDTGRALNEVRYRLETALAEAEERIAREIGRASCRERV